MKSKPFGVLLLLFLRVSFSSKVLFCPPSSPGKVNDDVIGDKWPNMTLDNAQQMNQIWTEHDQKNMCSDTCIYEQTTSETDRAWHLGWCRHTGLSPKGAYKLAMIGNSYAANHANLFYQECGKKAKSILQGSAYGCEPLYPSQNTKVCQRYLKTVEKRIAKEQPDYAFIFTRYISIGDKARGRIKSFAKDPIYQVMKAQMLKLTANIKYKLYILDAYPRPLGRVIPQIVPALKHHVDPVKIDKRLVDVHDPQSFKLARARHAQLIKDCNGKCVLVDYVPKYFNKTTGTYRYFDEKGFSYNTGGLHMSPHGLEQVRDIWRAVCAEL